MTRWRFDGEITGLGTGSGVRIVVGHWWRSPLGEFTDVMVELADGHRVLLAPSDAVRDFVTATYVLDETVIAPVRCSRSGATRTVEAGDLRVSFEVGARTTLGRLLNLIPRTLASAPCSVWSATRLPVSFSAVCVPAAPQATGAGSTTAPSISGE